MTSQFEVHVNMKLNLVLLYCCRSSRQLSLGTRKWMRGYSWSYQSAAGGVKDYGEVPLQVFAVQRSTRVAAASNGGQVLSPAVRYLVGTYNISDPSAILASGPNNRLLKGDVLKYLEDLKTGSVQQKQPQISKKQPTPPASRVKTTPIAATHPEPSYTDLPLDSKALAAAKEIVESKQAIPHIYFTTECRLPPWVLNKGIATTQALMIKSAAQALEKLPETNAVWQGDRAQLMDRIDISYHTMQDGHVTQRLISGANRLSLKETTEAVESNERSERSDAEVRGNISIYQAVGGDIRECTGILRPWQTVCLYISRPHIVAPRTVSVTLSGDSRVLSHEMAAKWLQLLNCIVSESSLL